MTVAVLKIVDPLVFQTTQVGEDALWYLINVASDIYPSTFTSTLHKAY